MNIFISGSLAYDRLMNFPQKFSDLILPDQLDQLNVSFVVNGMKEVFGGTAGNIAYSLALLGEAPRILATVGYDFGKYEARLKEWGLPLDGIKWIEHEATGACYLITDVTANQINFFNAGAMGYLSEYPFTGVNPADSIAIVSPGGFGDMEAYPKRYKELGIKYILDPGQNIPSFGKEALTEMIRGAEILISNGYELELIMSQTGLSRDGLLKICRAVITTLGQDGSLVVDQSGETRVPAVPIERALDPTGAGDAYRAGLIKGLVMGRDLVRSAEIGATLAAWSVEQAGTQDHAFTPDAFWARHKKAFGE